MAPMSTRVLYDSGALRATMTGHGPDRVMFTFDHWRAHRRGMPPPPSGTSFTTRGFAHIHVATARNDWFLASDLAALLTTLAGVAAPFAFRAGVGFSMGGYGLLLVSRAMRLTQALFISPQTAFAPDLSPGGDHRFAPDMADPDFAREAHGIVRGLPPSRADCVILFDPLIALDAAHAAGVAQGFAAPRLVTLPGAGHPVTDALPPTRAYGTVVRAACAPGIAERIVTRAYARARRDPMMQLLKDIRPKGEEADYGRGHGGDEHRGGRQVFRDTYAVRTLRMDRIRERLERRVENLGDPDQCDHQEDPAPVPARQAQPGRQTERDDGEDEVNARVGFAQHDMSETRERMCKAREPGGHPAFIRSM